MPMYEYRCESCGYAYERYSAGKVVSEGAEKCLKCGKTSLKKVFSTFASACCSGAAGGAVSSGGCGGGNSTFS